MQFKKNPCQITSVKLFFGLISKEVDNFSSFSQAAPKRFGPIDSESEVFPFDLTSYYHEEMGKPLFKKFIGFEKLIKPDILPEIKKYSVSLERKLSKKQKRTINIDPGYLTAAKVVLASVKNYSHRIYLRKGVFAELALYYKGKAFQPLPWTYTDYKSEAYIQYFENLRKKFMNQAHVNQNYLSKISDQKKKYRKFDIK